MRNQKPNSKFSILHVYIIIAIIAVLAAILVPDYIKGRKAKATANAIADIPGVTQTGSHFEFDANLYADVRPLQPIPISSPGSSNFKQALLIGVELDEEAGFGKVVTSQFWRLSPPGTNTTYSFTVGSKTIKIHVPPVY